MTIFNGEMQNIFKMNKFTNILPNKFKIFAYEKFNTKTEIVNLIIYISTKQQDLITDKLDTTNLIGYIHCVASIPKTPDYDDLEFKLECLEDNVDYSFDKSLILNYFKGEKVRLGKNEINLLHSYNLRLIQKDVSVNYIYTDQIFRGYGIGQFLMILASTYFYRKYKIKKIILDDNSDNSRGKNNLYVKLGMYYIEDTGPEMEGYVENIVRKWSSFRKKYTTKMRKGRLNFFKKK